MHTKPTLTFLYLDISRPKEAGRSRQYAFYECSCGTVRSFRVDSVKSGYTSSCGCYSKAIHGLTNTPLHLLWQGMLSRCKDLSNPTYGGRGIKVCDEWLGTEGFIAFNEWAQASGYFYKSIRGKKKQLLSLDRIDNDGPYSPENCRWATAKQQARNKQDSLVYFYDGKDRPLKEIVENYCNLEYATVYSRLFRWGWSIEESITLPKFTRNKSGKTWADAH